MNGSKHFLPQCYSPYLVNWYLTVIEAKKLKIRRDMFPVEPLLAELEVRGTWGFVIEH